MDNGIGLAGGSMQVTPEGTGCGGMVDSVAQNMTRVVNPAANSTAGQCDKLFRKSSFAEILERYSTVFPRLVSTTPGAAGGDLILTHGGPGLTPADITSGSLEFFRNGIDQNNLASAANPIQTQNVPALGQLGIGENAPMPLSLDETNGLQPTVSGSDNADFVQDTSQDFIFGAMSIEVFDLFTIDNAAVGAPVRRRNDAWLYQGLSSYEERLLKLLMTGSNLRISWRDEGTDRFYRVGRPIDWPSYTGLFGGRAMTPGQPTAFAFKELPFALQTNRRPKVDSNARVRFYLDMPRPLNLPNDPSNIVPANISDLDGGVITTLRGSIFAGVTLKLFGAMVCVDPSTGLITDKPAVVGSKMYDSTYSELLRSGMAPQAAAEMASRIARNAETAAAR